MMLGKLDLRTKLAEDLICFLVEFELCGYQVGQVAQRLRCIKDLEITLNHIFQSRNRDC